MIYEVLIWVLLKMKSKYPDGLQQKEMLYLSKVIRTTVSLRRGEQRINHSAIRMPRKKRPKQKELHPPLVFSESSVYTAHDCPKDHAFPL